jgi:hypothetical protein
MTMMDKAEAARRESRQARVGKAVWGLILMTMGALFFLDELGMIDMSDRRSYRATLAVDGNPKTRWSSGFRDPQWITVDLGAKADIARVRLRWEDAYAKAYELQVSDDGASFTTAKTVTDGHGGIEEHEMSARGRYLRVLGTKRATPWGYSLWELEVYGKGDAPSPGSDIPALAPGILLSQGMTATASSREGANYLALYWPVLLIGAGLPALIAPKAGGDQLFGLFLAGTGVFFQLQRLAVIDLSFARAWPILLLAAGLLLVIQALRQMTEPPEGRPTPGGGEAGSVGGMP